MPNWCENEIRITGTKRSMARLIKALKIKPGSNKEVTNLLMTLAPYNKEGEWDYNDSVKYWGTKWDLDMGDLYLYPDKKQILLYASSAWAPPIAGLNTIAEKYDVVIENNYNEPGMGFDGVSVSTKRRTVLLEENTCCAPTWEEEDEE